MESSKHRRRRNVKSSDNEEKPRERARTKSKSPLANREKDSRRKRGRSKSRSPNMHAKQNKESSSVNEPEIKKDAPVRRPKETDMLNTKTGGAYIPPARLRMMQAQITDKSSNAYQRLAWEALKKSIHGHINKINVGNIGIIIKELLKENIVRGRGLLCRSVIQAQAASPTFTNVYAALVGAVNSRFPNIGELLLKRLVIQFKRGFKRNDKSICISSASFIAHLVNQRVAHEILALELLTLLVEKPTDDSVEVAVAFLKECGQKLTEVSSRGINAIFEMLRNILHEGQLDKRVQYMIEVMFQVWKDGFKDHPALIENLEIVPEEEQFTHLMVLDEVADPQDILNVFKFDDKYEENEQKYKTLSKEILGSDAESGEEDSSDDSDSDEAEGEDAEQKQVTIIDNTETNLVALRRTIYLTINSSLDFEECAHKLMKMQLKPGQEVELCHMFLDCCAEQRTYEKFYGLLAQRFCNINRIYIGPFEDIFKDSYSTAHRLDTNRLRNVSKFFAHLLFTDSISWEVLDCVQLNEDDTTSSSRIYIKILFQELAEYMGLKKLNDRLKDPTLQSAFSGVFPRDNPKNTRFSINFFTSIGLGGLTDELREHLKQMPKNLPPSDTEIKIEGSSSESSSDSSSDSDSGSDSSSSDEEEQSPKKSGKNKNDQPKDKEATEKAARYRSDGRGRDDDYKSYGESSRRMEARTERWSREDRSRNRNEDHNSSVRKDYRDESYDDSRRNRNRDDYRRHRGRDSDIDERYKNGDYNKRRSYDERGEKNGDRGRRGGESANDRHRNMVKGRREQRDNERYYRDDDKTKRHRRDDSGQRDDDRPRKGDYSSYYSDDRRRERRHSNTDKDIKENKRYEENREHLNDEQRHRDSEKFRKDDDRSRRSEDRRRYDNREQKHEEGRKETDKSRKLDDKTYKGEEKRKREYSRTQNSDDDDYRGDRSQKDQTLSHTGENRSKKDGETSRKDDDRSRKGGNKSRKDEDRTSKDEKNRRTDERDYRNDSSHKKEHRVTDEPKKSDIGETKNKRKGSADRTAHDSKRKRKEYEAEDNVEYSGVKEKNKTDNDETSSQKKKLSKPKEVKKELKKKDKNDKKVKKHNKREESSSDDSYSDSDDSSSTEDTNSDTDSTSSSCDDSKGPSRYWDSFDIQSKGGSIRQQKADVKKAKSREKKRGRS